MKQYKISEQDLLHLLKNTHILNALWQGGVDNWSYYADAIHDYTGNLEMKDIAREDLNNYESIDCNETGSQIN